MKVKLFIILITFGVIVYLTKAIFSSGKMNIGFHRKDSIPIYPKLLVNYKKDSIYLMVTNLSKFIYYIEPVFYLLKPDSTHFILNYSNLGKKEVFPTKSKFVRPNDSIVFKMQLRQLSVYARIANGDRIKILLAYSRDDPYFRLLNYQYVNESCNFIWNRE